MGRHQNHLLLRSSKGLNPALPICQVLTFLLKKFTYKKIDKSLKISVSITSLEKVFNFSPNFNRNFFKN